jgi:hypothetical protein
MRVPFYQSRRLNRELAARRRRAVLVEQLEPRHVLSGYAQFNPSSQSYTLVEPDVPTAGGKATIGVVGFNTNPNGPPPYLPGDGSVKIELFTDGNTSNEAKLSPDDLVFYVDGVEKAYPPVGKSNGVWTVAAKYDRFAEGEEIGTLYITEYAGVPQSKVGVVKLQVQDTKPLVGYEEESKRGTYCPTCNGIFPSTSSQGSVAPATNFLSVSHGTLPTGSMRGSNYMGAAAGQTAGLAGGQAAMLQNRSSDTLGRLVVTSDVELPDLTSVASIKVNAGFYNQLAGAGTSGFVFASPRTVSYDPTTFQSMSSRS